MNRFESARDRLAVALDVSDLDGAEALIKLLADVPGWLKVGGELFTAAGPAALAAASGSARVFLDTKLHDIPNTVARSVAAATRHGVGMLTLHASGGSDMLRAAREAADATASEVGTDPPLLVAVTVLTSLTDARLAEIGLNAAVEDQVARLVDLAIGAGIDGVVASPREAAAIRRRTAGTPLCLVTPGIRSASDPSDDQARSATPSAAISDGADLLVVGRPVLRAASPAVAARRLIDEIEEALRARQA